MISTEAWVLHRGQPGEGRAALSRQTIRFADLTEDEILVRPLFGCWEGNMEHALQRVPIDVCAVRNEASVVLGNAGVVEVVDVGRAVRGVAEGDVGILFCNGVPDAHGYPIKILGYDAPDTMGVLAKRIKIRPGQFVAIRRPSTLSLVQWAAFSLRYVTAWANWHVAYGCFRAQLPEIDDRDIVVWGWGGGVALAELDLARRTRCKTVMITSSPARLAVLNALGIDGVDRSAFRRDRFDDDLFDCVRERTAGRGVSIFIDNIGANFKATVRALAREGVIATSGWKHGATFPILRSMECINRHIHVFTHYARYAEGVAAVRYAEEHGWAPPLDGRVFGWDEMPALADAYHAGTLSDYFPIFAVDSSDP